MLGNALHYIPEKGFSKDLGVEITERLFVQRNPPVHAGKGDRHSGLAYSKTDKEREFVLHVELSQVFPILYP